MKRHTFVDPRTNHGVKFETAKSVFMVSTCTCLMNGWWDFFSKSEILNDSVLLGNRSRGVHNLIMNFCRGVLY